MAGTGISGKDGDVTFGGNSIAEITEWNLDKEAYTSRYNSNKTEGFKRTVAGAKSGSGSAEFVFAPEAPIDEDFEVGEEVDLTCVLSTETGQGYAFSAVIKTLKIKVNRNNGDFIGGTMTFETNGAWTNPAAA